MPLGEAKRVLNMLLDAGCDCGAGFRCLILPHSGNSSSNSNRSNSNKPSFPAARDPQRMDAIIFTKKFLSTCHPCGTTDTVMDQSRGEKDKAEAAPPLRPGGSTATLETTKTSSTSLFAAPAVVSIAAVAVAVILGWWWRQAGGHL